MKLTEALDIIKKSKEGYLVAFEKRSGGLLASDHFPDIQEGEDPIKTEAEAWDLAAKFAAATNESCVNIYVIHSEDFTPVPGYAQKKLRPY